MPRSQRYPAGRREQRRRERGEHGLARHVVRRQHDVAVEIPLHVLDDDRGSRGQHRALRLDRGEQRGKVSVVVIVMEPEALLEM